MAIFAGLWARCDFRFMGIGVLFFGLVWWLWFWFDLALAAVLLVLCLGFAVEWMVFAVFCGFAFRVAFVLFALVCCWFGVWVV